MKLPEPGDVLAGKYRIEGLVGEGGFATVMEATTLTTGRRVAVKLLRPSEKLGSSSAARFQREMKVIGQLSSPHTLTLFDHGRTDHGVLYMVCELVGGEDLTSLLARRGRLQEPETIWILHQLLLSLDEAHRLGVLHRDIKPDNIRVFPYADDPLRVKLLDFGIAHSMDDGDARLTGTGRVIGTPRYMSPEQRLGEELSPASDLYAVGLVACEMLAGREVTSFRGGRPPSLDRDSGVSGPLRQIVNRMTSFEADERYQSAAQVLADLRRLMSGSSLTNPLPAAQDDSQTRTYETSSPHRSYVRLGLVAGALVVTATVAFLAMMMTKDDSQVPATRATRQVQPELRAQEPPAVVVAPIERHDVGPMSNDAGLTSGCGKSPPFLGRGTLRQVTALAKKRRMVYIPRDYDVHRRHPVIILLREAGQARELMIEQAGFGKLAEREQLVLFAPGGGDTGVDITRMQGKLWNKPGDIEDLRSAWTFLDEQLCLDSTRMYVVGGVSGGVGAMRVACEWRATAIATHGYGRNLAYEPCTPKHPTPYVSVVHSDDRYSPSDGGKNVYGIAKISWDDAAEEWRAHNNCLPKPRRVQSAHGVCLNYDCATPFTQCRIDGGRPWPGTSPPVWENFNGTPGGQASEFDSVGAIWKFFEAAPPLDPPGVQ